MTHERIDLYSYFNVDRGQSEGGYLTAYVLDDYYYCEGRLRPAMLVIPGGGYAHVSGRENEAIALQYVSKGFNAFTLEYSVAPSHYPVQLIEGAMATAYIRANANKYHVIKDKVAAIGFSAGGHLAAMLGTLYGEPEVKAILGELAALVKPDALVLSYPVITTGIKTHGGSAENLSGGNAALKERLSLEKRVTADTPPCFIWHTANDPVVPVENSLFLAAELKKNGVPFELHVFENGVHGLSLCRKETVYVNEPASKWIDLSQTWLKGRGFEIKDPSQEN